MLIALESNGYGKFRFRENNRRSWGNHGVKIASQYIGTIRTILR
jgi:hypothetical protein